MAVHAGRPEGASNIRLLAKLTKTSLDSMDCEIPRVLGTGGYFGTRVCEVATIPRPQGWKEKVLHVRQQRHCTRTTLEVNTDES